MPATGHILLENEEQGVTGAFVVFAAASACTALAAVPTPAPVSSGERVRERVKNAVCQWLEKRRCSPPLSARLEGSMADK